MKKFIIIGSAAVITAVLYLTESNGTVPMKR